MSTLPRVPGVEKSNAPDQMAKVSMDENTEPFSESPAIRRPKTERLRFSVVQRAT